MGLTIHYHGRISSNNRIPELTAEVTDVCQTMGWRYGLIDEILEGVPQDFVNMLGPAAVGGYRASGLWFQVHEKAESTTLCFGPDGLTLSPMALHRPDLTDWDDDMLAHYTFTKTQYAGPEAHMALCRFLKYLSTKYFSYLEVKDEGNFYHAEDTDTLKQQFYGYGKLLNQGSIAVAGAKLEKATSIPELLDLLTKAMPGVDIRLLGPELEEE
jgi:hypothetical protein